MHYIFSSEVDTLKTLPQPPVNHSTGIASPSLRQQRRFHLLRPLFLLAFLAWIVVCASPAFAATPPGSPVASVTNTIGKQVELNGSPMPAGATLYPGDAIRLGEGSTAALR